jgi:spore coat polysaccharide biosynthesis protein SpsF
MSASRPTLVVIQSRLASTRLPAKALLPLAGRPTVVLCALRAANSGLPVVIATSDEPADDAIAVESARAGIACFRGSHHDVLKRFGGATQALPDDATIVRLTADNVFPDGAFVEALLGEFHRRRLAYLGTGSPQDGLPYGMSAEVFTTSALRRAQREAVDAADREHVTPWIRRQASNGLHVHHDAPPHWSRLRCTLDSFDDYERLLRVFDGVVDPVEIPWQMLVERLTAASPQRDAARCPFRTGPDGRVHSALTLGTVQLGVPYGIANRAGMPDDMEVDRLLREAVEAGITALDTARAYGQAESRIGRLLPAGLHDRIELVTKLDVLDRLLPTGADAMVVRSTVDASVFASAHALRRQRIDTLLLHRWAHRHGFGGAAWERLLELKRDGVITRLGASVSDAAEAVAALADPDVGHLQCPVNLLDSRWRSAEFLAAVRARPDVVVHARSVLLQGMLTLPASQWVRVPGVDAGELCATLDRAVSALGRLDRVDLCMAYVRALPWVTSLVVGMESVEQLTRNLALMQRPPLHVDEVRRLSDSLPPLPESLLNPARWGTSNG